MADDHPTFISARWAMRSSRQKVVHSTGFVCRSDGNDTDCGAACNEPTRLLVTDNADEVTCRRCLRILAGPSREPRKRPVRRAAPQQSSQNEDR